MNSLSDKIKIFYLIVVIMFSMAVFAYLLDSWGLINLENYIPGLAEEASLVGSNEDHPTELEWIKLKKEQAHIQEERIKLDEQLLKLEKLREDLKNKEADLAKREKGLEEAKKLFTETKKESFQREKMISEMADRLTSMPPQDAVKILAGWSNTDTVDVFWKMEENSQAAGRQSIVPFLLTLMPSGRAATLTTLMMDAQAQKIKNSP